MSAFLLGLRNIQRAGQKLQAHYEHISRGQSPAVDPFMRLNSVIDGCEVQNNLYDDCKDEWWHSEPDYVTDHTNG